MAGAEEGDVLDGLNSTWVPAAVIAVVVALLVVRIRVGRAADFDRTPAQRWTVRVIDALGVAVVGAVLLAVVGFVLLALLSLPWPELMARVTDRGAGLMVVVAVVLFVLTLWLTPAWFRPASLRAMRDDEAVPDSRGRRAPKVFDGTGRTYADGSGLDPRDGS